MTWSETDTSALATIVDRCVVDVREPDEYESGHIPGAISIPLSVLTESLDAIPASAVIHVVCQAGGRSARACEFLSQQDRFSSTRFVNVNGGTGAWILEGHDIVVGKDPA
jgi:rhodanese-related sulfurtransferase